MQVWSTDITYIRLQAGFVYLTAVIDWFSRKVMAWELSNSLDGSFCLKVVDAAFQSVHLNTDQGVQYTAEGFVEFIHRSGVRLSMDGRGRALDNIFVERLWRSVKYEEVYQHEYSGARHARQRLGQYFKFYNSSRQHQALDYRTPDEVHDSAS